MAGGCWNTGHGDRKNVKEEAEISKGPRVLRSLGLVLQMARGVMGS